MELFVYFAAATKFFRRTLVTIAVAAYWDGSKADVPKPTVCWNSSICVRIQRYILRQNLTHVYVGGPSKCAGSTIVEYLGHVRVNNTYWSVQTTSNTSSNHGKAAFLRDVRREKKTFTQTMQRSNERNCPYAVTGAHLSVGLGLETMLNTPCSGNTLFLVTVRKLRSWFASAVRTVCTKKELKKRADCTTSNKERQVVRSLNGELRNGPMDKIKEKQIKDSRYHVLLVNYKSIMQILSCLPLGGVHGTESTEQLAANIYFRSSPLSHSTTDGIINDAHSHEFNFSTPFEELLAIYKQATQRENWLRQYLLKLDEGRCEVGSWSSSFQLHR